MGFWEIVVPEATTNYTTNPSFEDNVTDGWAIFGAGAARAQDSTYARWGAYSAKVTGAAGVSTTFRSTGTYSLADGATVTASAWMYREDAETIALRIYDSTTPAVQATTNMTETDAWERVEVSWTNDTGGAATVTVDANLTPPGGAALDLWIDGVQVEVKSYVTT